MRILAMTGETPLPGQARPLIFSLPLLRRPHMAGIALQGFMRAEQAISRRFKVVKLSPFEALWRVTVRALFVGQLAFESMRIILLMAGAAAAREAEVAGLLRTEGTGVALCGMTLFARQPLMFSDQFEPRLGVIKLVLINEGGIVHPPFMLGMAKIARFPGPGMEAGGIFERRTDLLVARQAFLLRHPLIGLMADQTVAMLLVLMLDRKRPWRKEFAGKSALLLLGR
jgi:hypothetical protein